MASNRTSPTTDELAAAILAAITPTTLALPALKPQTSFIPSDDEKDKKSSHIEKRYGEEVAALLLPHPMTMRSSPNLKMQSWNFLPEPTIDRKLEPIDGEKLGPHQVMGDPVTGEKWLCKIFQPSGKETGGALKQAIIEKKFPALREYVATWLLLMEMPGRPPEVMFQEAKDGASFSLYSKIIEGFKGLDKLSPKELSELFNNPKEAQALGELYIHHLDLQEVDFKLDNIGIDGNRQIRPIDKGCCLGQNTYDFLARYGITAEIINDLPRLRPRSKTSSTQNNMEDYRPYNWVPYFRKSIFQPGHYNNDTIFNPLKSNPNFRAGVCLGVLKKYLRQTCVLPVTLRSLNLGEGWQNYFNDLMVAQTEKFKNCASEISGFAAYLHDRAAEIHVTDYIASLRIIKLADGSLFSDRCLDYNTLIYKAFDQAKAEIRHRTEVGPTVHSSSAAASTGAAATPVLSLGHYGFHSPNAPAGSLIAGATIQSTTNHNSTTAFRN